MREKTMVRSIERSTSAPAADDLAAALARASLSAAPCGAGIYRLRSPAGRTVYVEARSHGASGGATWLVHADAHGREAPRQLPCATIGAVLIAVRGALAGNAVW